VTLLLTELATIADNESRMHALVASLDRKLISLRSNRDNVEKALAQLSDDKAQLAKRMVDIQSGLKTLESRMSDISNQLDALKTQVSLLFAAESEAVAERRRARGRAPSVATRPTPGQSTQPVVAPVRALVAHIRKSVFTLVVFFLVFFVPFSQPSYLCGN
jgi:chromosome segregation ATPase